MSFNRGKGKGKGKVPVPSTEDAHSTGEVDAQSILSRVAASASGLTRSAFSAPNNDESAIVALANSGKGNSSSNSGTGSSAWAESSKSSQPSYAQASVKVGHSEEHVRQSEEEFSSFLNGIDSFPLSEPSGNIGVDSYKDIGSAWGEAWAHAQTFEAQEVVNPDLTRRAIAEQEALDGQGVLDLLSSPGWISQDYEALPEDVAPEDYDWGLTQDQISQIRVMTRHLTPPEPHSGKDVDHPLNLVPNLGAELRAQWIEQWDSVLTRYADEVWGGLLPLVKGARKEVKDIRADGAMSEEPTALRRLQAILGHLQQC
jgi:hypothetical protein